MRLIYGVVIDELLYSLIIEYLVKSKKYEKFLEGDRSICLERYSSDEDLFLIRRLEQFRLHLDEIFSEIKMSFIEGQDIYYIGEYLIGEDFCDEEIKTTELDGQTFLNLGKIDKHSVQANIDRLVSLIPSLKNQIDEPRFMVLS